MPTLTAGTSGPSLMRTVDQTEERTADSKITVRSSEDRTSGLHRCFRQWMGCSFKSHTDTRIVDSSRKRLHQCEGIEDDTFCLIITSSKRKRLEHQDVH